jgi:molybdopterin-guanine dinucleotide biosynthesis protein A
MSLARGDVALGILAGGQALRLGGVDKALVEHRGGALLARTLAAMGTGYAQCLLSYNREPSDALRATLNVVPDLRPGFPGPLAGIEALLAACEQAWLLTLPVDLREIPVDVFEALGTIHGSDGARARDADGAQPLVALWRVRTARVAVAAALDAGDAAVHRVQDALGFEARDFSPRRFGNLNTPADFAT